MRKLESGLNAKKKMIFSRSCDAEHGSCSGEVITQDFIRHDHPSLTATLVYPVWHCEKHATWELPICRSCHIGEHEACTGEFKAPWNMDGICHCVACGRGHPRYKEQESNA